VRDNLTAEGGALRNQGGADMGCPSGALGVSRCGIQFGHGGGAVGGVECATLGVVR
jgi:hypothetical protein